MLQPSGIPLEGRIRSKLPHERKRHQRSGDELKRVLPEKSGAGEKTNPKKVAKETMRSAWNTEHQRKKGKAIRKGR